MARTLDIEPLDATFGAVVRGIKVADARRATFRALLRRLAEYALLIFPDQHLHARPADRLRQALRAARVRDDGDQQRRSDGTLRLEKDNDDVMKILKGNMGWHHDSTYMPVQAKGAVFSAEEVPSDRRPHRLRRHARRLRCARSGDQGAGSKASTPTIRCTTARAGSATRPRRPTASTRGYGLHDGRCRCGRWSRPIPRPAASPADRPPRPQHPGPDAGRSPSGCCGELIDFACQPPRIYHHDWTAGDAVVWDNRCLMHQATPWDMTQRRIMWHSRIAGDPASESAQPQP